MFPPSQNVKKHLTSEVLLLIVSKQKEFLVNSSNIFSVLKS